jgi:protein O-GlcNAc transferase
MSQGPDEILDAAEEHHRAGRFGQAIELYRQALTLTPHDAEASFLLGLALFQFGQVREAIGQVRRAIELDPDVAEYHCDLSRFLFAANDIDGALSAAEKALELRPDFPEGLFNLGNSLCRKEMFDEGTHAYRRVIALRGDDPDGLNNLGMAFFNIGRIDEAVACFDRILARNPNDAAAHSNRIYALHFHPDWDADAIGRELARWNEQHARRLKPRDLTYENDRSLDRPLRIGLVSADLREHVVGWNIWPLLKEHDPQRFQIFCYSAVRNPDGMTRELKSYAFAWREILGESDERAAQMIREDRIDILVDLSLHTGGNRLLIFARKPAPIQVTYLAYPGSSGLETMDYRFSDRFLDLKDEAAQYSERTIWLGGSYWCYRPGGACPEIVPPPVDSQGVVTFGCLNQFQKISASGRELWQRIMLSVPGSRLIVHAPRGECRVKFVESFERGGVSANRIEFVERVGWAEYIQTYQRIDIALDPLPYGGGITTCDALWMGVPVVTLRGRTGVGRGATSILSHLQLRQLIAGFADEYLSIAKALAGDAGLLSEMRFFLRKRMSDSPLLDPAEFRREIESAFAEMGKRWVESQMM